MLCMSLMLVIQMLNLLTYLTPQWELLVRHYFVQKFRLMRTGSEKVFYSATPVRERRT